MKNHLLKKITLHLLGLFCIATISINTNAAEQLIQQEFKLPGTYQPVNLHDFVEKNRKSYGGKISIVPPQKISFSGVLKAAPEKKATGYLYTALKVMEISPLPTIEYQMFIGAPDYIDTIISVYVDNALADNIQKQLPAETQATWFGYHIYTYSRGPAIVIDNVVVDKPKK